MNKELLRQEKRENELYSDSKTTLNYLESDILGFADYLTILEEKRTEIKTLIKGIDNPSKIIEFGPINKIKLIEFSIWELDQLKQDIILELNNQELKELNLKGEINL